MRDREGRIEARWSGDVSKEELDDTRERIVRFSQGRASSKILIDASQATTFPGTLDIYGFPVSLTAAGFSMRDMFAIVTDEKHRADAHFLENAAQNRGINLRSFGSLDDALAWLSAGSR